MRKQCTLAREFRLEGLGLHRGDHVELRATPAPEGTGLVFVRDDLGGAELPALQCHRTPMINASRLALGDVAVDTPEHLLAALFALGVDNARLHLNGSEVPILDGSALPFCYAVLDAGVVAQDADRTEIVVTRPILVEDEGRRLEIHPGQGLRLTAAIDFEHAQLGYQELTVRLDDPDDFLEKLAPARTFALRRDVERLLEARLIKGGSLESAVLVDDDGVVGGGLRYPDEFVRHKLLDVVGDLALIGCGLVGRMVAWRSGHALHGRLVDAIVSERRSWHLETGHGTALPGPSSPMPPESLAGGRRS